MRLLFDENLSPRLALLLSDQFPGSVHVRDAGLSSSSDSMVWEYAREHGLVLVSKDSDFSQRSFVHGAPPPVVWLRVGNRSTSEIADLLSTNARSLEALVDDPGASLLILSLPLV